MSENKKSELNNIIQLVSFRIGEEQFGVDILKVQEINRMVNITRVPNSPRYVEGVINLRGKVIPIIDLRTRLGVDKKENNNTTRIIVVELEGKTVGFIVDSVSEVLRIPANITEVPPPLVLEAKNKFITSIARFEDRMIILLDIDKILSTDEADELIDVQ